MTHRKPSTPKDTPKRKVAFIPTKTPKYTESEVEQALIECGGFIYATAYYLDINPSTLRSYMKRWPNLYKVRKQVRGLMLDRVEHSLYTQAVKGNVRACNRILTQYGRWESPYKKHEVNVSVKHSTELPPLSDEDKNRIVEAARKKLEEQHRCAQEALRKSEIGSETLRRLELDFKERPASGQKHCDDDGRQVVDAEVVDDDKE